MATVFEEALYNAITAPGNRLTRSQAKLLHLIETDTATPAFVAGLEQATLAFLGVPPQAGFDWSFSCPCKKADGTELGTINWATILAFLEQLLPFILPLFGG